MLNIKDCAIVVIDIQERLLNAVKKDELVDKAEKIIMAANILDIPVIITEQYPKGLGQTAERIQGILSDQVFKIEKNSFSALLEPQFVETLNKLNKKQILIFGIEAHICVYQTICDLIDNNYEVYYVQDASASRNLSEFQTGKELIQQAGAKITSTEITLFELLRTSKHPHFKEIQNLIK